MFAIQLISPLYPARHAAASCCCKLITRTGSAAQATPGSRKGSYPNAEPYPKQEEPVKSERRECLEKIGLDSIDSERTSRAVHPSINRTKKARGSQWLSAGLGVMV